MARLTRFELTRIVSARSLQLSLGAPPLVKVSKESSMLDVAEAELVKGLIPLSILRRYPNGNLKRIEVTA